MTNLNDLAARVEEAAAARGRLVAIYEKLSPDGAATAGALVLAMYGHLFAECATALRSRAQQEGE